MRLEEMPKIKDRSKKRLGRGYASGKGGHTSSRGQKGQKSRNSVAMWFEGGQLPLIRRLPFQRGKRRFKSLSANTVVIKMSDLEDLPKGSVVTEASLLKAGKIQVSSGVKSGIKVLGQGRLTKSLTVKVPVSQKAKEKIEAVGGAVVE